jgi:FAD/FMN-containing dehydrogenase
VKTVKVQNFGKNINFSPAQICRPSTETQLLEVLNQHSHGKVRVFGALHSWSDLIKTEDLALDMSQFNRVEVIENEGVKFVKVGAGCQIKTLLKRLNEFGLTIPSIGLITEQTVAGATATGTHGSGKHSLSHYIVSLKIACFIEGGDKASIYEIKDGVDLRAARCSLGALGVITEITLPCISQYYIEEKAGFFQSIDQVLTHTSKAPLQQFYLLPHSWRFLAQHRVVSPSSHCSKLAIIYRIYWFVFIDLGMHLVMKLFATLFKSKRLIRFFYRSLVPSLVFPGLRVTDRSDKVLVMRHELFRHLEIEIFVKESRVKEAADFAQCILRLADDANYELPVEIEKLLCKKNLFESLPSIKGGYCHHYPICFRRILPDDTLISMASNDCEDYYAISLITYSEPRDSFYTVATFLADAMFELFDARIHWGKWFPLKAEQTCKSYTGMPQFREVCAKFDPNGIFRNEFVEKNLGFEEY